MNLHVIITRSNARRRWHTDITETRLHTWVGCVAPGLCGIVRIPTEVVVANSTLGIVLWVERVGVGLLGGPALTGLPILSQ